MISNYYTHLISKKKIPSINVAPQGIPQWFNPFHPRRTRHKIPPRRQMAWASRTAGRGQAETLGTQLRKRGAPEQKGKDGRKSSIQTLVQGLGYIDRDEKLPSYIWKFPKMVGFPNWPMGKLLLKMISTWVVKWGYHHLRKHPYRDYDKVS